MKIRRPDWKILMLLGLLVLVLSGCGGPYLKLDPALTPSEPRPSLMTSAIVSVENDSPDDGVSVFGLLQNTDLDRFGQIMTSRAGAFLLDYGLELYVDREHARRASALNVSSGASKALAVLAGAWISPDGSTVFIDGDTNLRFTRKDLKKKLATGRPGESFTFVTGKIEERGIFFKRPIFTIDIVVVDAEFNTILSARGIGKGDSSFLVTNRTATNLERAMNLALDELATIEGRKL
jgi:hypothetical protein